MTNTPKSFSTVGTKLRSERSTVAAVISLATVIFVIDAFMPLGVAGGVPYVAVILVALRSSSANLVYGTAVACSLLTLADIAISPGPGNTEWWKVIVNRCLALFAIWVTAFLGRQRNIAAENERQHLDDLAHLSRTMTAECLAGSLAHELNQPLTAVALQAEIARKTIEKVVALPSNCEVRDSIMTALGEIAEQSHRASMIVRALRALVRRAPSERQMTDLNVLVQDSTRLTQLAAKQAAIEFRVDLDTRLPQIEVDRIQIQQVILNLLQNSIDALQMSNSVERLVIVSTRTSESGEVVIEVSDSGPGFSPEQRLRVFQPFSSSKSHGLGLGLNISRSIIEAHGGRLSLLDVDTTATLPSRGTRFAFTLPAS